MIIVTGATGQLGRLVVEHLLTRVPAERIGVSVRETGKAEDLADRGVRVRQGDFDDPGSLAYAFEGVARVLIVSGPADAAPHRTAIEAAAAAGAKRIVYTSHMGANPASPFLPMPAHAETERDLSASGVPFTALRNGFYAATIVQVIGQGLRDGEIVAPADGPVSWTAHADLAEAAAVALAEEGGLDGITPPLTGPEALDLTDIAAIASELTGREITRVTVPDDEWITGVVSRGVPEGQARFLLGMYEASRQGEFAEVCPALGEVLGRKPTAFRDVLAATLTP
ncbi:NAD(P)H-binding protein [Microbispora triticiradicis]|uniref:NAD(P)H-binding protein n=2 Tax=Microbispora TaxID=2005 RepID=A0ABY3LVR7_9ACTN|nr:MULTISPECIES: NAD(P)H-binding protein [Microbispora]TLP62007.1 NAD-dependent epimerase/dehydratase family protein [Microbispora fusca]TYB56099.1 NAD(P)H-binding protein [Microbispora tritici]GLW21734.1 NmrA family transcriptional regulator [Microbispora amethystogenes]